MSVGYTQYVTVEYDDDATSKKLALMTAEDNSLQACLRIDGVSVLEAPVVYATADGSRFSNWENGSPNANPPHSQRFDIIANLEGVWVSMESGDRWVVPYGTGYGLKDFKKAMKRLLDQATLTTIIPAAALNSHLNSPKFMKEIKR